MTKEELTKIIENQNWNVRELETNSDGVTTISFETWSNAGEDLYEMVDINPGQSFTDAFFHWANSFDPEEHVEMWLNSNASGVPSVFVLVEDAKDIEKMFWDLADAIRDFENDK